MARSRSNELTPGKVLHRIYDSEIYEELMQIKVPKDGLTNHALIKSITDDTELMDQVVGFIEGKIDLLSALNIFKMKLGLDPALERYAEVKQCANRLFMALTSAVSNIRGIRKETEIAVGEVSEVEETPPAVAVEEPAAEIEANSTIPIPKGEDAGETIQDAKQIKITIEREGKKKNHILNAEKKTAKQDELDENGRAQYVDILEVTCLTSDIEEGKTMPLKIEQGDQCIIGIGERKFIEKAKKLVADANEKLANEQKIYDDFIEINPVSQDAKDRLPNIAYAERKVAEAQAVLDEEKESPLVNWFTPKDSADISPMHIVITYSKDGSITVDDEGEKCSATMEKIG